MAISKWTGLFGLVAIMSVGSVSAQATSYQIGQRVEIEASGHWVPCTVSEIQNYAGGEPLIRVNCTAYPALSRSEGIYIVHNNQTGIRPATGRIGPIARVQPVAPARVAAGNSLKVGEYGCVGVGGRILIGLAFKVTRPGHYTDLDNTTRGTYAITRGMVRFSGGHLAGQTGRALDANGGFRIGTGASCGPW